MKRLLAFGALMFGLGMAIGPRVTAAQAPRLSVERLAEIDREAARLECELEMRGCITGPAPAPVHPPLHR